MGLTILSDDQVLDLLENLTVDELDSFRAVLASALHDFSTTTHSSHAGLAQPYQQPHRISTRHGGTKATTLYMPSCGPAGMACKVISATTSDATADPKVKAIPQTGVVNLFDPEGKLVGVINAATLTAFRTALNSCCLLNKRNTVRTVTVFGTGQQAYWHVRLALMMRGTTIKHVNIINHRFSDSAGGILKRFTDVASHIKEREGWTETNFSMLTPTFNEFARLEKEYIRNADVIYCCTPSRKDLFDASILTSHEGRKRGRLIVAIGSFTPEMREIPEAVLLQAVKPHSHGHRHYHKHAQEGGVIVVDSIDATLKEAGELIAANIGPNYLVELGELVMLHRQAMEESETDASSLSESTAPSEVDTVDSEGKPASATSPTSPTGPPSPSSLASASHKSSFALPFGKSVKHASDAEKQKEQDGLAKWLSNGNVIFKCVGMGLMDLVVGAHVIKVAQDKQVGTLVPDF